MQLVLTPELLMEAYRQGLFPMAYNSGSPYIHWLCPEMRGQLSIETIHLSHKIKKLLKKAPFEIRVDTNFSEVVDQCAQSTPKRPETWINTPIFNVFCELHNRGVAHSVECWQGDKMVGGIYGLAIGGAFFGESMFSRETDASKIALFHLVARLWKGGFKLLDTQFVNEHLKQFNAYELAHDEYKKQLDAVLGIDADFNLAGQSSKKIMADYLAMRESD